MTIALPVVISNATVPILGAVDTGVVGQIGQAAPIGAVGIGAIIISAVYWMFGFLRMGTAGLTAQALGAGKAAEVVAMLVRVLLIGAVAGVVLILLQWFIFRFAFWVAPASPEVEGLAKSYLAIRIYSAPAAIAIYGITGWLFAHERTSAMLLIQLWMNGLNIVLDLLFVLGFGWGVEGVAIATLIAEWTGLAFGLYLVRGAFHNPYWSNWTAILDRQRLIAISLVNFDIMLRSVLLQIGFMSFLFLGARFDDVTLAANQVLLQFLYVTAYAMDGFAFAAEALVGQAIGAKHLARLRRAVWVTSIWGIVTVIVLAIAFAIFGPTIIDLMAKSGDVQSTARVYLIWMILAPLLGCASWMLDGIFIGAVRTREMRNMMAVSFVIYVAVLWLLVPNWGNHGLWAALIIFFIARGATLALVYPRIEREIA